MAELIFFESFLLLLLGLGFCELEARKSNLRWANPSFEQAMSRVHRQGQVNAVHHIFFKRDDFTDEEIARRNKLAMAVLEDNRLICKRCGREVS